MSWCELSCYCSCRCTAANNSPNVLLPSTSCWVASEACAVGARPHRLAGQVMTDKHLHICQNCQPSQTTRCFFFVFTVLSVATGKAPALLALLDLLDFRLSEATIDLSWVAASPADGACTICGAACCPCNCRPLAVPSCCLAPARVPEAPCWRCCATALATLVEPPAC